MGKDMKNRKVKVLGRLCKDIKSLRKPLKNAYTNSRTKTVSQQLKYSAIIVIKKDADAQKGRERKYCPMTPDFTDGSFKKDKWVMITKSSFYGHESKKGDEVQSSTKQ